MPPAVAIVIPCHNHGAYLREAVSSAQAQRHVPIECVIVDDGSTDAQTQQVLAQLEREGLRIIRQENQGLAAARNAGVCATTAPFFVPLDADDRLAPDFVSKLLPPLLQDSSLGYCYSHVRLFGAAGGVWRCPAYDGDRLLIENLSVATAVVRRAAFERVGGYRTDMTHGLEDWDLWVALYAAGYRGHCVPEPLFEYRRHAAGSMLATTAPHRVEMIRRMIEHHRGLYAAALGLADPADAGGQNASSQSRIEELHQAWLARRELAYIENSRSWRLVRCVMPRRAARLDSTELDPRTRLARIKASRAYRLIQAAKRTPVWRWLRRADRPPEFDQLPAE